jgi:hypothetical protein
MRIAIAASLMIASIACAEDAKPVEYAGMKSTPPAEWKKEEPKEGVVKRLYQFKLPKADGDKEDAELALFFFNKGAGTIEENLKRQVAKFNPADGKDKVEEKVDKTKVGTIEATYQDVSGTFVKKPFPMAKEGTPMPNYRQLYIAFETKDGQYFMTLLGPTKTIEKNKKGFEEWLKNFK